MYPFLKRWTDIFWDDFVHDREFLDPAKNWLVSLSENKTFTFATGIVKKIEGLASLLWGTEVDMFSLSMDTDPSFAEELGPSANLRILGISFVLGSLPRHPLSSGPPAPPLPPAPLPSLSTSFLTPFSFPFS
jgi:hypothetical protein